MSTTFTRSTLIQQLSPQPGQLNTYTEVLQRLNASIAFGSSDGASLDTVSTGST